jgi:hypothetical protein
VFSIEKSTGDGNIGTDVDVKPPTDEAPCVTLTEARDESGRCRDAADRAVDTATHGVTLSTDVEEAVPLCDVSVAPFLARMSSVGWRDAYQHRAVQSVTLCDACERCVTLCDASECAALAWNAHSRIMMRRKLAIMECLRETSV